MFRSGLILLALSAVPTAALAGVATCHFEGGVLVVPAEVAGIAGEYVLDTGTAATTLHDTVAGEVDSLTGPIRLAGEQIASRMMPVADLDVRLWNLPTAVSGVIGADALAGYVVDVSFTPCRVRLWRPGSAPRFDGRVLPMAWDLGRPTVVAEASDRLRTLSGPFVLATGQNVPVRLADDLAKVAGASRPQELYPDGVWMARLSAITLAGLAVRDVGAGLMTREGDAAGVLGGPLLSRFRLRFDFPARRVVVADAQNKRAPDRSGALKNAQRAPQCETFRQMRR